jgi:hypothetical protein
MHHINLEYIPSKDGFVDREFVSVKSLGEWLRQQIFIASVNAESAKEEKNDCEDGSQAYDFALEEVITSKAEMDSYNQLLMELGYPYYKGISNGA